MHASSRAPLNATLGLSREHTGSTFMAKIGSEKRPIIVRVRTEEKGEYVAEQCAVHGWHYIIGLEPGGVEDISDLENALNPAIPIQSEKTGRNDPCSCGSGKKYKKCCG